MVCKIYVNSQSPRFSWKTRGPVRVGLAAGSAAARMWPPTLDGAHTFHFATMPLLPAFISSRRASLIYFTSFVPADISVCDFWLRRYPLLIWTGNCVAKTVTQLASLKKEASHPVLQFTKHHFLIKLIWYLGQLWELV